jgi:hypothetical protein
MISIKELSVEAKQAFLTKMVSSAAPSFKEFSRKTMKCKCR